LSLRAGLRRLCELLLLRFELLENSRQEGLGLLASACCLGDLLLGCL
jgi:hypothetical protein